MRRLYRSRTDLMIGGVCGGLGEYFAVDPTLVRLFFVLLTLAGGSGVLLYLLLWIIIPPRSGEVCPAEEPAGESTSAPSGENTRVGLVFGIALVALGAIFLLWNLGCAWFPWFGHRFWSIFHRTVWPILPMLHRSIWPLLLMAAGFFLLLRRTKGD